MEINRFIAYGETNHGPYPRSLFNPAVTLTMVFTGSLPPMRGLVLFPAQLLGGICAAAVVSCIVPGDIRTVQTTLAPKVSSAQGVFLEMVRLAAFSHTTALTYVRSQFLTSLLCFTVLMLAAEKSKDTFIAPIGIGLSLFVAEVAGVYYTGASLNPARSFGPCVAGANFQTYHWIYWIGPFLGALISGGYFHFVKFFNYEEANPGQDSAGDDQEMTRAPSARDTRDDRDERDGGDTRGGARNGGYHPGYAEHQA